MKPCSMTLAAQQLQLALLTLFRQAGLLRHPLQLLAHLRAAPQESQGWTRPWRAMGACGAGPPR